jgi:hypothetical protein
MVRRVGFEVGQAPTHYYEGQFDLALGAPPPEPEVPERGADPEAEAEATEAAERYLSKKPVDAGAGAWAYSYQHQTPGSTRGALNHEHLRGGGLGPAWQLTMRAASAAAPRYGFNGGRGNVLEQVRAEQAGRQPAPFATDGPRVGLAESISEAKRMEVSSHTAAAEAADIRHPMQRLRLAPGGVAAVARSLAMAGGDRLSPTALDAALQHAGVRLPPPELACMLAWHGDGAAMPVAGFLRCARRAQNCPSPASRLPCGALMLNCEGARRAGRWRGHSRPRGGRRRRPPMRGWRRVDRSPSRCSGATSSRMV